MLFNPLSVIAGAVGLPTWLLTTVCVLALLYYWGTRNHDYFTKQNVPQTERLVPFLGNLLGFLAEGTLADIGKVKKYGKVFGELQGSTPVWVVGDPEVVRQIGIKEFSHFVNRRTGGFPINREFKKALTIVKDAEWKGIRNVMTPTFSSAKMKKIVPLIQSCADDLVDRIERMHNNGQELEMKELSGCYSMDVIARTQFSIETNTNKEGPEVELITQAKSLFANFNFLKNPYMFICFVFPALSKYVEAMGKGFLSESVMAYFGQFLSHLYEYREKIDKKPHDFLELMMEAHDIELDAKDDVQISSVDNTTETSEAMKDWRVGKKAMSKEEILSNALLFFLAGYETTATGMCWLFHVMAQYPDVQEKLFHEVQATLEEYGSFTYDAMASMKYMDQVFCETSRMYPSAQRADRMCNQDCQIGDYTFKKGDIINFSIWAIHHDADYWPEPENFIPERFAAENRDQIVPYSYLNFGLGPRNCVGQRLAVLESKLGLATALRRFRFVKSEHTEDKPAMKTMGMSQPEKGIHLRVEKRK